MRKLVCHPSKGRDSTGLLTLAFLPSHAPKRFGSPLFSSEGRGAVRSVTRFFAGSRAADPTGPGAQFNTSLRRRAAVQFHRSGSQSSAWTLTNGNSAFLPPLSVHCTPGLFLRDMFYLTSCLLSPIFQLVVYMDTSPRATARFRVCAPCSPG